MKFKTVVIVFNIVIVASFLFIFLVPLALLGPSYFSLFFSRNWVAGVLFAAALTAVNAYFAANWRLFGLLEREDWPGLVQYLETQVYRKKRVHAKQVRLLVNAYLVTSNSEAARALEQEVRRQRPSLMPRLALPFGIPYLLSASSEEAEKYFGELSAAPGVRDRPWLRWNHAFCLCRRADPEAAGAELREVLRETREPVLRLLALYLLDSACGRETMADEVARGREELVKQYPREKWNRVVEAARSNVQVVVLSRVIEEAAAWVYGGAPEQARATSG